MCGQPWCIRRPWFVNHWLLIGSVLKSLAFGLAISTIACFHGIAAGTTASVVPQAAIKAVIRALLFVLVLDILFAGLRLI